MTKFMTFTLSDLQRQSAQDFVKSRLDLQEELLQELKLLKQDLNSKLELEINQEYSSFISLPLNLIGSDEIILDFKSKLSDALLQLQSISEDYQGDSKLVKDLILKRQDIRKEKQKLKIQVQVSERLSKVVKLPSPDLSSMAQFEEYCKKLDRYSIEYSQLQFLCSQVAGNGSERLEILEMKANLSSAIQTCFRKCFQELLLQNRLVDGNQSEDGSVQARLVQNEGQIQTLQTCTEILVRISATLGTLNPTGEIFKQVIIDPFLAKLSLVQEHDLFPSVKDFLDSHCLIIDKVANSRSSFVVDGWQSICQYLLDNQPMIFHVSSPQRFHDLFQSSQKVIEYITENEANSLQLRAGTVYRDFCKRWQLSVYFQLINNEHVSNFEQCLSQDTVFESGEIDGFKLRQTVLLFKILKHIWGPNVFIRQLGHRFTKMTIIIIFRYIAWFKTIHSQYKAMENPSIEHFLNMYTESFSVRLAFLNTVSEMKTQLRLDSQATSRLDAIASQITSEIPITETLDDLVNELTKPLVSVFQNVSTIPAQYRLTNKPIPTTASPFMGDIFKDINAFVSSNIILNSPTLRKTIAIKVLEMYEKSVVQVLDSVRQIEENLKRFKRKNTLNGVSDETKVRNQIKVDVEEFFNQLKSFGVDNLEDSINTNLRKVVEESFSIQQGI